MTRSSSRFELNPRLFGGPKFSVPGIKAIDHYLVQAKVGGKSVPVRTIQDYAMSVWAFLALFVYAGAVMLYYITGGTQAAIALNGEDGNAASAIVRDDRELAGSIDNHVT